jgi:hypothetical protein
MESKSFVCGSVLLRLEGSVAIYVVPVVPVVVAALLLGPCSHRCNRRPSDVEPGLRLNGRMDDVRVEVMVLVALQVAEPAAGVDVGKPLRILHTHLV